MSQNNTVAEYDGKANIYFKWTGGDQYSIKHSDKLTTEQANSITKISIRISHYLRYDDLTRLTIANILALLVIQFNTDLTTLSNAPKGMFMLDINGIFKAYSVSDGAFKREPHFLSDSFKGFF